MNPWKFLKALWQLSSLVEAHWALLNIRRRQITWACVIDGKPARLPVIIICQKTGRWLVEFPDGSVDFVDPRPPQTLRVGLHPVPPT